MSIVVKEVYQIVLQDFSQMDKKDKLNKSLKKVTFPPHIIKITILLKYCSKKITVYIAAILFYVISKYEVEYVDIGVTFL